MPDFAAEGGQHIDMKKAEKSAPDDESGAQDIRRPIMNPNSREA
jgi:hypothetical protein